MPTHTPTVWIAWPTGVAAVQDGPQVDTPAWFAWLDAPTTTSFAYPVHNLAQGWIEGFMTVRKEPRARGGVYWTAYWRVHGHLSKVYLGRTTGLTDARLHAVAASLLARTTADTTTERR